MTWSIVKECDHGYVPFVIITTPSVFHLSYHRRSTTGTNSGAGTACPSVAPHSVVRVAQYLVFYVVLIMFCLFVIVLYVYRFTV